MDGPTELADTGGLLAATVRTIEDESGSVDPTEAATQRRVCNSLRDALSATVGMYRQVPKFWTH
jgi:hypothetical protein